MRSPPIGERDIGDEAQSESHDNGPDKQEWSFHGTTMTRAGGRYKTPVGSLGEEFRDLRGAACCRLIAKRIVLDPFVQAT